MFGPGYNLVIGILRIDTIESWVIWNTAKDDVLAGFVSSREVRLDTEYCSTEPGAS